MVLSSYVAASRSTPAAKVGRRMRAVAPAEGGEVRFRAIAAVAALCLLAVGCGGKNEAKPTPTTHEKYVPVVPEKISEGTGACALLTQGEVAAAVGLPANPGDGIQSEGGGSCHWSLRGSGAQSVNLVTLTPGGSPYEQTLSTAPKPIEPLSGVGDHAFI